MTVRSVVIRGRRYRVKRPRDLGGRGGSTVLGHTEHPKQPSKTIAVRADLVGEQELEVFIHEFLHAGLWELDEECVAELGQDIARALTRLGWRKSGD